MNKVDNCLVVFRAMRTWINQRPGLDFRDYGEVSSYRAELYQIAKDRKRALEALEDAERPPVDDNGHSYGNHPDLLSEAFARAFSGRLTWNEEKQGLEYCTGGYWPTEYRKAAASVLETYCAARNRRIAERAPKTFEYKTLADVRRANKEIGNHWFDASTLRWFGTRFHGGLIGGRWFITSEQPPHGARKYSVREARPDGTIDTVGEFCSYNSLESARLAMRLLKVKA